MAASVVTAIGYSLFTVGARSFGGGYTEDFGSAENLFLGTLTLVVCLIWNIFAKGYLKQLSVLAGLIVGYIVSIFMGRPANGRLIFSLIVPLLLSLICTFSFRCFVSATPIMPWYEPILRSLWRALT